MRELLSPLYSCIIASPGQLIRQYRTDTLSVNTPAQDSRRITLSTTVSIHGGRHKYGDTTNRDPSSGIGGLVYGNEVRELQYHFGSVK